MTRRRWKYLYPVDGRLNSCVFAWQNRIWTVRSLTQTGTGSFAHIIGIDYHCSGCRLRRRRQRRQWRRMQQRVPSPPFFIRRIFNLEQEQSRHERHGVATLSSYRCPLLMLFNDKNDDTRRARIYEAEQPQLGEHAPCGQLE